MILGGIHFSMIPGGTFQMGAVDHDKFADASEKPRRTVEIPHPFLLSTSPISEAEWRQLMGDGPVSDLPKVRITHQQSMEFCRRLSNSLQREFRLPTEAEWEYACRGGTDEIFQGSAMIDISVANYLHDETGNRIGIGQRTTAGVYPANNFGLYDMLGNVCEWTADGWAANDGADLRVIRGGAWDYMPRLLRCSWRDFVPACSQRDNLGFRVAAASLPSDSP